MAKRYFFIALILAAVFGLYAKRMDNLQLYPNPNNDNRIITVISPNGGEVIRKGLPCLISWATAVNASNVKLELFRGEENVLLIANNLPNMNTFNWFVPLNLINGSNYRLKVSLLSNAGTTAFDFSNEPFTIASQENALRQY